MWTRPTHAALQFPERITKLGFPGHPPPTICRMLNHQPTNKYQHTYSTTSAHSLKGWGTKGLGHRNCPGAPEVTVNAPCPPHPHMQWGQPIGSQLTRAPDCDCCRLSMSRIAAAFAEYKNPSPTPDPHLTWGGVSQQAADKLVGVFSQH
jgi:hypothetical protein